MTHRMMTTPGMMAQEVGGRLLTGNNIPGNVNGESK